MARSMALAHLLRLELVEGVLAGVGHVDPAGLDGLRR